METAETNDDAASSTTPPLPPAAEAVKTAGQEGPRAWPKPSKVAGSAQGHRRTSSFQRWMHQMQSTWTSVPAKQEPAKRSTTFNPEVLMNQKRQWYQFQSRTLDRKQQAEPTSLFEQFFIVGLRSDANVDAVEDGFAKRKTWELEMEKSEILDLRKLQYGGPPPPTLEPQILFKYPRRKRIGMRVNDLPAFCFPGGVKKGLVKKIENPVSMPRSMAVFACLEVVEEKYWKHEPKQERHLEVPVIIAEQGRSICHIGGLLPVGSNLQQPNRSFVLVRFFKVDDLANLDVDWNIARLMERTPSMSDLNEVVYGQLLLSPILPTSPCITSTFSDLLALSEQTGQLHFRFEIVQRAPGILGVFSPLPQSSGGFGRFLVSAPRCYCILTKVPFFELHYEMLNRSESVINELNIITVERLERITQFANEMALRDLDPPVAGTQYEMDENLETPKRQGSADWMASAIPVGIVLGLHGASPGFPLDKEVPPDVLRQLEPQSPESLSASEDPEFIQARELDRESRKSLQYNDDSYTSEISEFCSHSSERMNGSHENGLTSLEVGRPFHKPTFKNDGSDPYHHARQHPGEGEICTASTLLLRDSVSMTWNSYSQQSRQFRAHLKNNDSPDTVLSITVFLLLFLSFRIFSILNPYSLSFFSARSMGSDDDTDEFKLEKNPTDEHVMEWAKIVCGYHALSLPPRGAEIVFQPLDHLQPIKYNRPGLSALDLNKNCTGEASCSLDVAEVNAKLAAAEESLALSIWTTATVCRALSLESGILSATVLSIIPMIRPFQWQSLMLPAAFSCLKQHHLNACWKLAISPGMIPSMFLQLCPALPYIQHIRLN
ncbi:hypothetical protein ACLOJK_011096 [Asimina triloba]